MEPEPSNRADADDVICPFFGEATTAGGAYTCSSDGDLITVSSRYATSYCRTKQHVNCGLFIAARSVSHPSLSEQPRAAPLSAGYQALARSAWKEARVSFEEALHQEETPQALEGLGIATAQLKDVLTMFSARERAYWLYQEQGDPRAAARMATWLALDRLMFYSDAEGANLWFQRAHRLLKGLDPGPEHGWLALAEGQIALLFHNDRTTARRLGSEAAALGRVFGLVDLEEQGLALERRAG
jgi:hypothetical protein